MTDAFDIISPIDCSVYANRHYIEDKDLAVVVRELAEKQRDWAHIDLAGRLRICERFLQIIHRDARILGEELTWMMGRPTRQTAGEFDGVRERAEYMLAIADSSLRDAEHPRPGNEIARVSRVPCGVVLIVAPWNYPYLTAINSLIPALVAGNAVVIKHSPQTPMAAERLVAAFREAGLPDGIFSFAHCNNGQLQSLIAGSEVNHVVFTGSVAVGRLVGGIAAQSLKRCTLELGGKDAAYIRSDTNLHSTAAAIADGAFFNAGQSCCAIERIYVSRSIHDEFVDALVGAVAELQLGDPRDNDTTLGPVATDAAACRIRRQIDEAEAAGATVISPGQRHPDLPDTYLAPTILIDVDHDMRFMREETFGPAVGVLAVGSDDEAVERIHDSTYGLTASIWTGDTRLAENLGGRIATGTWYVNRCDYLAPCLPWSGRKDSGVGCSLSELGYLAVTRPKSALIRTATD